jgi:L-lactate dehydrogenase (cytochrome)
LAGGRDVATAMLERVKKAGFTALVVTIDTAVSGFRERDYRNGIKELLARGPSMLPYLPQVLMKPGWLLGMFADGGIMKFPNVLTPDGPMPYSDVARALEESMVTWDDFRWIREIWNGPIMVKGVHTAVDAKRAVDAGAAALVVSNHGGRQLDSVAPSIRALLEVEPAVRGQIEVLVDGGIRRGSDVVKAICLGARAVLVGRAYAYGLAAAGEVGVARAIEILRADVIRTLKLLGVKSIAELDRSYVEVPSGWMH